MSESNKGRIAWNKGVKGQVAWNKGLKGLKGTPHTEESKRKRSEAHKGKHLSEEHKRKLSEANKGKNNPNYGKHLSDETKRKISEKQKGRMGRSLSEEEKQKLSEAWKGESNPNYGKVLSKEQKRKMREAFCRKYGENGKNHPNYGLLRSEETKQKISEAKKGGELSEEHKRKIGEAHKGKHRTEKQKQRISEAKKGIKNPNYGVNGENASNWKGGISFEPYCPKFNNNFKERVREFFGRCCYVCGKNEADNGGKLSVHHVNYQKSACCEEDVKPLFVPLCASCHAKTHYDREYWEEFFTESLMFLTNGKCWYEKDEVETLEIARIPKALYTLDDYV